MRYFPQLETRTAGQYPLRRERQERVVRHEALDGRVQNYYDSAARRLGWVLRYEGLTDGERAAIDALFAECEGRLHGFVFLDPAANLLRWSEDFSQPIWTRDPALTLMPGWDDPWGTVRATQIMNSGPVPQRITQVIEASGQMQYCLSVHAAGGGRFRLQIEASGVVIEESFEAAGDWARYSVSGRPGVESELVTFRLTVEAGEVVRAIGLQAEAQPAAGGYRRTTSRSGVYPGARFATDELAWTQQAPNNNAAVIPIESRA
jgi:hypothetical protein